MGRYELTKMVPVQSAAQVQYTKQLNNHDHSGRDKNRFVRRSCLQDHISSHFTLAITEVSGGKEFSSTWCITNDGDSARGARPTQL